MTAPTIGRVVYYRPSRNEVLRQNINQFDPLQPFRADVVFVNLDNSVNLTVCDHAGQSLSREGIPFFETAQDTPDSVHAHWMPYQVAQAVAATPVSAPAQPAPSPTEPPVIA